MLSGGSPHDLWAGLVAAGLGFWGFALVRAGIPEQARFRWRFIRQGVHVPGEVISDTRTLLAVLMTKLLRGRPADSGMLDVPFDGHGDSAERLGRQILAIIYGTTSPNLIAVAFEGEPGQGNDGLRLVVHQLRVTPNSASLRHLGAKP